MPVRNFTTFLALLAASCLAASAQQYKLTHSIHIGGTGGWDYLATDSQARRLYVSHNTEVEVLDLDTEKVVGKIPGADGVHGIALAPESNRGYISSGRNDKILVFDLKTLKVLNTVTAGSNPDGIVYEPINNRVLAFNGRSKNATVLDAATGVTHTIALDGKPEFPVADGNGVVFVNIEDKSEIQKIDAKTLKVENTWPLSPCESPSGLAIDRANRRLFSVCDNKLMAVVNADSGKVVATPAIGEGPDAAAFDPELKLAFSSNGESGTLTVVREQGNDKYSVLETVTTKAGARTMALDEKTHKIYLSDAEFGPAPAATADHPHPRRSIKPDSFKVLVVERK
jgi:YVTN family beta-propeller protein